MYIYTHARLDMYKASIRYILFVCKVSILVPSGGFHLNLRAKICLNMHESIICELFCKSKLNVWAHTCLDMYIERVYEFFYMNLN